MSQSTERIIIWFYNDSTMVAIKLDLLLFLNILYVTDCKRRITDGRDVSAEKSYVVYLIKAPNSGRIYDEWLCGGALVSTLFIVTSAACVADVEFMYAIAGYNKYVKDSEVETDKCTKEMKKKVIYTCVPMKYQLDYHQTEVWSFIDIALVKVESPYDLNDNSFKVLCSYLPTVIPINYEARFQKPGTDTLTYGWGHTEIWRKEDDKNNYNKEFMQFAASKIIEKTECKKHYEQYANMNEVIDQYMLCTFGKGDFSDKGELEIVPSPLLQGCNKQLLLKRAALTDGDVEDSNNTVTDINCDDTITSFEDMLMDSTRKRDENINQTSNDSIKKPFKNGTASIRKTRKSRKHGICQNDHGGPLVTWIGGNEILIGVASVFKVSSDLKCMGPYLFTSTQCNGAFLDCILTNSDLPDLERRRAICDSPPIQRGYDTVERHISWSHHPAGPADNEMNAAKAERDGDGRGQKSPREMQNLIRLSLLTKMARNQSDTMLRQRGPTVPHV